MRTSLHTLIYFVSGFALFGLLESCSSSKATTGGASNAEALRSTYASRLGVAPNDLENTRLYRVVDEWEGTPYAYGGQSKRGVDCSGFVGMLYREVYDKNLPRMVEEIYKECDKRIRRKKKLEEGDLVFFDIKKGKKASHAGVYLQNGHFIHASTSSGVVISKLSNPYYRKHFHRGGRIR